jgi:hypothetical protein
MGREEITFHLFFSYPFSQHCWNHLNINWNFNLDFYSMMLNAREQFGSNFFMEIFMIAAWLIWKQRNDLVFNRARPSFDRWQAAFMSEAGSQNVSHPKKIHFHCSFPCTDRFPLPFGSFGAVCWFLFRFLQRVLCLPLLYI